MSGGKALKNVYSLANPAAGAFMHDMSAAKKAKKATKKQIGMTSDTYLEALGSARQYGARGQGLHLDAINSIKKGNKQAQAIAAGAGTSAVNRVMEQEQAAKGALQQNLASRGLVNTTAADSGNRAIKSDTMRALNDINDSIARTQIGVAQSGAGAEAGAYQALAQFLQSQGITEAQIQEALAQFLGGVQHTAGPSALGSMMQLGKMALSFGAGGGGAGAASSSGGFVGGGSPSLLNLGG